MAESQAAQSPAAEPQPSQREVQVAPYSSPELALAKSVVFARLTC